MKLSEFRECIRKLWTSCKEAKHGDIEFWLEDKKGNEIEIIFDSAGQFSIEVDSIITLKLPNNYIIKKNKIESN